VFEVTGLESQLGVQAYVRERKFRERLRTWLKLVKVYGPECSASVTKDGQFLELANAVAVAPQRSR